MSSFSVPSFICSFLSSHAIYFHLTAQPCILLSQTLISSLSLPAFPTPNKIKFHGISSPRLLRMLKIFSSSLSLSKKADLSVIVSFLAFRLFFLIVRSHKCLINKISFQYTLFHYYLLGIVLSDRM